jgi:hypothetical protein
MYGPFFGEDPTKDAWNGILEILKRRWIIFEEKYPARANIVQPQGGNSTEQAAQVDGHAGDELGCPNPFRRVTTTLSTAH